MTKVGLAVGTTVGSYRIEEPCGRGGFAVVYRATHDKLKRPAALKVLHAKLVQRDDLVKRFTHEAQTITRIHHPNIVDIYDFGTLPDGRPYFAMEWLEGEALSHELRTRKRFQVHEAVQIAREVASGLGAIHKAGVVHRDLKSNNIMYLPTEAGFRIKLLDFGIAKLMDEEHGLSLPGMVLGTPETMAPEQIRGEEITPRADIYAFGILLYELLTGRLPFRADSDREIHAMQMSAPRPRVTDHVNVSDHFDAIVARCMAIDPSDRYDLISQVIRDLDEAASVQTSPDGPLAIGSVLADSYEITGILGRGGMGIVYEGEHTRLPKSLAIKIISGGIGRDSIARFKREAEIASAIGHANIVRVLDFNKLPDGTPYMVMERLEGEDLAVVLKRGPLDFDRVVSITRQTASALAAAHAAGVVHRDLKPSNIFLSMREVGGDVVEHVTVLDFGVSKIQDSTTVSTDTRALIGTPQYMAPEQAMGENQRIGAGSDQFALACLVYEMLTGKAAFAGDRLAEIVYKVCYSEPTAIDVLV
ncbi:MAG: serine/threonine protein kinase, partial [Deltaproteobacteria bacterium]|nr:serine/threonine protein kinase [Deltaproteobacteria bacterium]